MDDDRELMWQSVKGIMLNGRDIPQRALENLTLKTLLPKLNPLFLMGYGLSTPQSLIEISIFDYAVRKIFQSFGEDALVAMFIVVAEHHGWRAWPSNIGLTVECVHPSRGNWVVLLKPRHNTLNAGGRRDAEKTMEKLRKAHPARRFAFLQGTAGVNKEGRQQEKAKRPPDTLWDDEVVGFQAFWTWVTGDTLFALNFMREMQQRLASDAGRLTDILGRLRVRFTAEFQDEFCDSQDGILWDRLLPAFTDPVVVDLALRVRADASATPAPLDLGEIGALFNGDGDDDK